MAATRYTRDHEYIRIEGETGVVGISAYAQEQLGDIVFVELPEPGRVLKMGEEVAVVESVKAASEIYAPVAGEVLAVNGELADEPSAVNEDPLGRGWFFRMRIASAAALDGLMDEAAYEAYLATLG